MPDPTQPPNEEPAKGTPMNQDGAASVEPTYNLSDEQYNQYQEALALCSRLMSSSGNVDHWREEAKRVFYLRRAA